MSIVEPSPSLAQEPIKTSLVLGRVPQVSFLQDGTFWMLSLSSELSPNTEQFIHAFAKCVAFVCGLEFPVLFLLMLTGVRGANACVLNA